MNIKRERVHELAKEAAVVLGTTQTGAIEVALERLLTAEAATAPDPRVESVYRLLAEVDLELHRTASTFTVDDLYDDSTGLPR